MRTLITIAMLLLVTARPFTSHADSPPGPDAYVFATSSPGNQFYAVQTFTPIPFDGPQGATNRFQVYSTATGKLRWEVLREWGFGTQSEIMLADDGEHVIVLPFWISARGSALWHSRNKDISDADREELFGKFAESLNRSPVITFYRRGKVVKKIFFRDLGILLDSVQDVSVSHAVVHYQSFAAFYTSTWNSYPAFSEQERKRSRNCRNHRPAMSGTTVTVTFVDGKARTFDYTSGTIVGTEKVEGYVPRPAFDPSDPFGEPLPEQGSIQQTGAR